MEETAFSRSCLMLGETGADALARARILIVGCGGVGGWCAEALVRTGAKNLVLVDSDLVAPSNTNRQAMADSTTIGTPKVEALRERLLRISPEAQIAALQMRYEPGAPAEDPFNFSRYSFVIDAIDSIDAKAALIKAAIASPQTTLLSSMGAALKFDPTMVRKGAFSKVEGDAIARALRHRFKEDGWPVRDFTCVWSSERPHAAARGDGCNGSLMQVTAAFGLALASLVISRVSANVSLPLHPA